MWSTRHKHGTKKKSESPTGIEPVTFRAPVGCSNRLSYEGLVRTKPFSRFMWCICIRPSSPQAHRSSVVRISERWTEGLRFNSSRGLRFFLLSGARDMLISTLLIIFFTKLKINHLSLFITTIVMPPTLCNSRITCKFEQTGKGFSTGPLPSTQTFEPCHYADQLLEPSKTNDKSLNQDNDLSKNCVSNSALNPPNSNP